VRIAATRTLGVFLAVFAAGVLIRELSATHDDPWYAWFALATAAATAVLLAWIGSLVLRHAIALSSAVILLVASLAAATAAYEPRLFAPEPGMSLAPRQREALKYLMSAKELEGPAIGVGGEVSSGYVAMQTLWHSTSADAAFKQLVLRGTNAGPVYGLIGVRRTDPVFFEANRWRFETSNETVGYAFGCVTTHKPVARVISDPKALQLPAGMTMDTWLRTRYDHKSEFIVDIAGGGYTSMYLDPIR
jgi:hypothetical protein